MKVAAMTRSRYLLGCPSSIEYVRFLQLIREEFIRFSDGPHVVPPVGYASTYISNAAIVPIEFDGEAFYV
jgi:hypothetical protein